MDQHRGQDVDPVLGSGTFLLTALVIYRGSENPLQDERGFELSDQGTYGTAGLYERRGTGRDIKG